MKSRIGTDVMIGWLARQPDNVGGEALKDRDPEANRLADCPSSPNCVCSQQSDPDDEAHRIAPFAFDTWVRDHGLSADQIWHELRDVLLHIPRTQIVEQTETYLHAECRTALIRYTDDVEFVMDQSAETIHVRSASRWGHSDLGVNRRRIETLRTDWTARLQQLATATD